MMNLEKSSIFFDQMIFFSKKKTSSRIYFKDRIPIKCIAIAQQDFDRIRRRIILTAVFRILNAGHNH